MAGRAVGQHKRDRFTADQVPIIEGTFAGLTVQNPISLADLRTAIAAPSMSDNTTMRNRIQVSNIGGAYGKALSITLPNDDNGVVLQPTLPESFDEGFIEFDIRWRAGFGWGGGGKILGLGGTDGTISAPPSGGNPDPHGWGGRSMWLKDAFGGNIANAIEFIDYKYWPGQAAGSFGVNMHTGVNLGPQGGTSDGVWRRVKKHYCMNTCYVTDTGTDPATLVQGTHYLNDGFWKTYIDGSLVGDNTNQVLRFYQQARCTHLSFAFFSGGDATWADGGGIIDVANMRVVKIR